MDTSWCICGRQTVEGTLYCSEDCRLQDAAIGNNNMNATSSSSNGSRRRGDLNKGSSAAMPSSSSSSSQLDNLLGIRISKGISTSSHAPKALTASNATATTAAAAAAATATSGCSSAYNQHLLHPHNHHRYHLLHRSHPLFEPTLHSKVEKKEEKHYLQQQQQQQQQQQHDIDKGIAIGDRKKLQYHQQQHCNNGLHPTYVLLEHEDRFVQRLGLPFYDELRAEKKRNRKEMVF